MQKQILKFYFMLWTFFMVPIFVQAAPSISAVSGVINDGQTVVVDGLNFGSKISNQSSPIQWNDFNEGSNGQQVVEYAPFWTQGNNMPMSISDENKRIGNNAKAVFKASDPNDQSSMIWRDNVGFADTGKIYMNYWVRMDFGTALTPGYFQVKNVEIAVSESQWGNGDIVAPSLSLNHFAYAGPPVYTQTLMANYRSSVNIKGDTTVNSNVVSNVDYLEKNIAVGMRIAGVNIPAGTTIVAFDSLTITMSALASGTSPQASLTASFPSDPTVSFPNNTFDRYNPTWQNISMQINMGTPGLSDGSRWYWASSPDFSSIYAHVGVDNRPILDEVASKLDFIKLGWYRSGFVDGAIAAGTSTVQYDDLYIDNSWARVEIGDAPIYANCTHREIQIPISWSDSQIQFTLNRGTFSDGQAYLYVIDENGNPSVGQQITLVSESDLTAPASPTGLSVE